jgi:glycosyltransferase involved in cell wall biosynthesis
MTVASADAAGLRFDLVCGNLGHGGGEEVARQIAQSAIARGATVRIVNIGPDRSYAPRFAALGCDVEHHRVADPALAAVLRLRRRLAIGGADVVHAFGNVANLYGSAAARSARVPVIIASEHNPLGSSRTRIRARIAGRLAHRYIAVSQACATSLIGAGIAPSKVMTIVNGIDLRSLPPVGRSSLHAELGLAPETLLVGTIGSLKPQKNYERWLRVARRVAMSDADVAFVVIGDGDLRVHLEAYASRLGLGPRVSWLGTRDDAASLVGGLDVFLLASDREGLPLALCEAQAASVPIVATDTGGVREVVRDRETGFLCDASAESTLAERCLELLGSSDLRAEMGRAGKEWVRDTFDGAVMAASTIDLYLELLGAPVVRSA